LAEIDSTPDLAHDPREHLLAVRQRLEGLADEHLSRRARRERVPESDEQLRDGRSRARGELVRADLVDSLAQLVVTERRMTTARRRLTISSSVRWKSKGRRHWAHPSGFLEIGFEQDILSDQPGAQVREFLRRS
jgi:hypothetical protein